jgi:hypothetical protein
VIFIVVGGKPEYGLACFEAEPNHCLQDPVGTLRDSRVLDIPLDYPRSIEAR